jgi:hypothetical protein
MYEREREREREISLSTLHKTISLTNKNIVEARKK